MLRTLLVGINIIGIALLGFFQKSDPEINHDLPGSMKPGDEQVVTFNIEKSDITGFAKFQIELGPGLTAEVVKSEGASFTFNNQTAKFIWMALPSSKSMQIQMRLIAGADAAGIFEVKSRFSYIYANERKNIDVPVHIVAVGEEGAIAASGSSEQMDDQLKNLNAEAYASRSITPEGLNQWRVEVAIEKSTLQGFAKVEETVPAGFTVVDLKSSSAVFSVDNQTIKYIWYDIPENDVVVVSYKMLPVVQMDNTEPSITGTFSFLKDEETLELPILAKEEIMLAQMAKDTVEAQVAGVVESAKDTSEEVMDESIDAKAMADASDSEAAEESEVQKAIQDAAEKARAEELAAIAVAKEAEEAKAAQEAKDALAAKAAALAQAEKDAKEQAAQQASAAKSQPTKSAPDKTVVASAQKSPSDGNIVNVPDPEKGIFYRVQIAAGKNNLNTSVFAKLYNFDEGFKLETASGLLKYTTGYHQVYKSARDDRERITSKYEKFQGPFVAAYNDGERITVQEALMVSSQKWVP